MTATLAERRVSDAHAVLAAEAAARKHAGHLVILDVRQLSSVADYFVIGTAESRRQMAAIAEHVEEALEEAGGSVWHVEGLEAAKASARRPSASGDDLAWVLMDCGSVVVHLFSPSARDLYQLERLWADAPRRTIEPSA